MSDVMQEWREEERTEERIDTLLGVIKKLMKELGFNIEQAMAILDVSDKDKEVLLKNF